MSEINAILAERGAQYGEFTDQATLSQNMKSAVCKRLMETGGIAQFEPMMQESMEMIIHKISRIANGNPQNEDSWRDIAGYALLVADRLKARSPQAAPNIDEEK